MAFLCMYSLSDCTPFLLQTHLSGDAEGDRKFQDFLALLVKASREKMLPHVVSRPEIIVLVVSAISSLLLSIQDMQGGGEGPEALATPLDSVH